MSIAIFKNSKGYWDARVHDEALRSGAVPVALWQKVQKLVLDVNAARKWPVWIEGYRATGEQAQAVFVGDWPGLTFTDACQAWATAAGTKDFDRERLMHWGRRMFQTEAEAREVFG